MTMDGRWRRICCGSGSSCCFTPFSPACRGSGETPGGSSSAASIPKGTSGTSLPSKERFQHYQKLLAKPSPEVPETVPSWVLVASGASELQENRAHHYSVSGLHPLCPFPLHPPAAPPFLKSL